MEDITDAAYAHAKIVGKNLKKYIKKCFLKYTNLILQNFFQLLD